MKRRRAGVMADPPNLLPSARRKSSLVHCGMYETGRSLAHPAADNHGKSRAQVLESGGRVTRDTRSPEPNSPMTADTATPCTALAAKQKPRGTQAKCWESLKPRMPCATHPPRSLSGIDTATPKEQPMTRPTDHAYEALAEVTNTDMAAGRGELNKALSLIRGQTSKQGVELGLEIRGRAKQYRRVMRDVLLTPSALAKHWARVEAEADRTQATNQAVPPTHCRTCGGDRFVVYSLRPSPQTMWMRERDLKPTGYFEEAAPCPDCGPDLGPRYPDPAQVRERISA